MTQMPMRQSLLKLLAVEPVAVSFLFVVVVVVVFLLLLFFFCVLILGKQCTVNPTIYRREVLYIFSHIIL